MWKHSENLRNRRIDVKTWNPMTMIFFLMFKGLEFAPLLNHKAKLRSWTKTLHIVTIENAEVSKSIFLIGGRVSVNVVTILRKYILQIKFPMWRFIFIKLSTNWKYTIFNSFNWYYVEFTNDTIMKIIALIRIDFDVHQTGNIAKWIE